MAEAKLTISTNAPQVAEELRQVDSEIKNITKSQKYMFDNAEIIAKSYGGVATAIRDTQKAQQQLSTNSGNALKREKGLIEDIEDQIHSWQKAAKEAWNTDDIAKFNKKIEEGKQHLKEYSELGKKTENTTASLSQSISKWALGLGGAAVMLKKLGDAFKDTIQGMNLFNQIGTVTKVILNDIVTTGTISLGHIQNAIKAQTILNDLRLEESFELVEIAKLNNEYQQQYAKSIDQTLSKVDQLKAADAALSAHTKAIDLQVEHVKKAIEAQRKLVLDSPTNEKFLVEYNRLRAELENLDAQRVSTTKSLISRSTGIWKDLFDGVHESIKGTNDAIAKWEEDWQKERLEQQKKYQEAALKLIEDFEQSQIDALEGKEKLEAQRKYAIQQLKEVRNQLAKLGPLTDEQIGMLQQMADNVWTEYYKQLAELSKDNKPTPQQQQAISEALVGDLAPLSGLIKKDVEKAQAEIDKIVAANEAMEPVSIWNLVGLDPEDDEDAGKIEAIKEITNSLTDAMDEIYERRVENAERTRELLDRQISETQRELELEAQLYEEGYANNVDAKRKELEELKIQRQQALVEEQNALKQQQAIERISQAINIASSAANILKQFTKLGPAGLALASIAIASLFTIWASTKSKAYSATELAEGGSGDESGMITGKRHSQGGERFLDHVEVESGESWGVLSRPASEKYGKVFHEIVNSFNKDQMPQFAPVSNNVRVENSGPNSRLDKVITEQKRLNENLLKQSFITQVGGKRVVKQGNKVRIIG